MIWRDFISHKFVDQISEFEKDSVFWSECRIQQQDKPFHVLMVPKKPILYSVPNECYLALKYIRTFLKETRYK